MESRPGARLPDQVRVTAKVAHLYHTYGLRQTEIAERLGLSQSRVSRLLRLATEYDIVRTTVVMPPGLNPDLEHGMERAYGLRQAFVVDVVSEREGDLVTELGMAAGSVVESLGMGPGVVGFTSWSRSLRAMVRSMRPVRGSMVHDVVEMLGDVGPPSIQNEASEATRRLAELLGAQATFLRLPGVVGSKAVRQDLLRRDPHSRAAFALLDNLQLALVGIGSCEIVPPLRAGENFFSQEQFQAAIGQGAVGQVNLRFIGRGGDPIDSPFDDLVIGISWDQLRRAELRIGVAGGADKLEAIRAALVGEWVNVLVTDTATAGWLLGNAPAARSGTDVRRNGAAH